MKLENFCRLLATVFGLAVSPSAHAQAALLGPGAAYIGGGVSRTETEALNDRLAAHGYPTFEKTPGAATFGGYRILSNRVMLGAELNGLIFGEKKDNGREVGVGGGYGTLGVGYMIDVSRRVRVYPRFGLGGGGFGLWIDDESDSVDFNSVLDDPKAANLREPVLGRDGLVMDVGGGLELLRSRRGRGPFIGLRAGYLFAPFDSSWNFYDRKATGGPDATISGPYIRVVVGGAWRR